MANRAKLPIIRDEALNKGQIHGMMINQVADGHVSRRKPGKIGPIQA